MNERSIGRRLWARVFLFAASACVLPWACSSKKDPDSGNGCSKNSDCGAGRICKDGACVADSGTGGTGGASGSSGASGSAGKGVSGANGTAGASQTLYGFTVDDSLPSSYDIQGIWGAASNDVWAVAGGGDLLGGAGQLHHWDGKQWEFYYGMQTPGFTGIWGVNGGSNVFFVGHGAQFYELDDGTTLSALETQSGGSSVPNLAVWGSAPDAIWVASNSTSKPLRLWTGEMFAQDAKYRSPDLSGATAVWGSAANDVWAADGDGILHFDGEGWKQSYAAASSNFFGIQGSGAADVWAVSPRHVVHFDGTNWKEQADASGQAINALWVAGPNDVWLVGDGGRILHGGTAGFAPVESGVTASLFAIWGTSATDIWAGGEGGVLIHYGPVTTPTEAPDGGTMNCNPQGYGCSMSPCCSPWRCTNIGGGLLVCA
jgi:hypothetical protein